MNSLTDVKDKIVKSNPDIQVLAFNGHTLVTSIGTFMMGPEFFYHDTVEISEKQLIKLITKKDA